MREGVAHLDASNAGIVGSAADAECAHSTATTIAIDATIIGIDFFTKRGSATAE